MAITSTRLGWPQNLPNHLVYFRLALCPLVFVSLYAGLYFRNRACMIVALAFLFAQLLSDYYDGKIARSSNNVTAYGARIDALSDKPMVHLPLLLMVVWLYPQVPRSTGNWLVFLWTANLLLDIISALHYVKNPGVSSINWGKWKLCSQAFAAFWGMMAITIVLPYGDLTPATTVMKLGLVTSFWLACISLYYKFNGANEPVRPD